MELEFLRRRIFNTTFFTPTSPSTSGAQGPIVSKPKSVYRTSTIHNWTFFPHLTTIEFVGAEGAEEDPEKRQVVAQIIWDWPLINQSFVFFGGHLYPLFKFLGCAKGHFNMDSFITFENETYTWRTYAFEPQLYDSKGRQVATYKRDPCGLRKPNSLHPLGHLRISEDIASNPKARDAVFTSFFIYKVTRNIHIPWKKPYNGKIDAVLSASQMNSQLDDKKKQEKSDAQTVTSGPTSAPVLAKVDIGVQTDGIAAGTGA